MAEKGIIEEVLKGWEIYGNYRIDEIKKAIKLTIQKRDEEVLKLIDEEVKAGNQNKYCMKELKQKIKKIK